MISERSKHPLECHWVACIAMVIVVKHLQLSAFLALAFDEVVHVIIHLVPLARLWFLVGSIDCELTAFLANAEWTLDVPFQPVCVASRRRVSREAIIWAVITTVRVSTPLALHIHHTSRLVVTTEASLLTINVE